MSDFLFFKQVGAEYVAANLASELKSFKREQRRTVRVAANLLKKDIIRRIHMRFGVWRPRGRGKEREIGPLFQKISARVFNTRLNVGARVGPNRRAFYGRFYETGVSTDAVRHTKESRALLSSFREKHQRYTRARQQAVYKLKKPYHVSIKPRPYIEPALRANESKVVEIIGNSYMVFTGGSRA